LLRPTDAHVGDNLDAGSHGVEQVGLVADEIEQRVRDPRPPGSVGVLRRVPEQGSVVSPTSRSSISFRPGSRSQYDASGRQCSVAAVLVVPRGRPDICLDYDGSSPASPHTRARDGVAYPLDDGLDLSLAGNHDDELIPRQARYYPGTEKPSAQGVIDGGE